MTDEVIDELRADWRRQEIQLDDFRRRLSRSRVRTTWVIAFELAMALIGVLAGLWYAVLAWQRRDLLFGLSALTMLVVSPPFAVEVHRLRRRSLVWADRTPEGTLRYALARIRLASRILRLQSWGGVVLLLFVGVVWAAAWMGWISRTYPLGILTTVWVSAAAFTLLWSRWRLRQGDHEHETCERLLSSFAKAEEDGSAASET